MAGKKENLKALFTNTRSRIIILFTLMILVVAVVVGFFKFYKSGSNDSLSSAVPFAPGIQSIPGALDPTIQYVKLQEAQNTTQARKALNTGSSAIPTIVQSQKLGDGVNSVGAQGGTGGLGFSALAREDDTGLQRSAWIQQLQNDSCSKATITEVVNQGAQLSDLKSACSCIQLKDSGYQLSELEPVCACKELKAAGYSARQLKDAGYSAGRLRACGYNACELRNAGFTAQEMKDGGFSDDELKGAGFSNDDINKAGGLPDGVTEAMVRSAGCDPTQLAKLRASGVTASAVRRISGCSAAQLKAAGYTAQELKNAGFTAADLKKAGFTAAQLKQAGFTARDMLNAGFSPSELQAAGYTPADIATAENELPPGISPDDVKKAGCDVEALTNERLAGVSAKLIKQYAGCSAQALKAAGFTDADLTNAGFTAQQIAASSPDDAAIRAAGCDPAKLTALMKAGVSAKRIHDLNGCSASQLKAAGFDAKSLLDAGFSPQELAAAGFTPQQIRNAQDDTSTDASGPAALIAKGRTADCSVQALTADRAAGMSASTIRQTLGCNAEALKAAGYTAAELKAAGFTAAELKGAGFSASDLKAAGFSAKELHAAGFSAQDMKNAGFSATQLKDAGFTAADLKAAGYSAAQLKAAGYSAQDLKDAGFSAADMKAAGYSAEDLKKAGYSDNDIKNAGYSKGELVNAGIDSSQVAGLSPLGAQGVNGSALPGVPGYQNNQSAQANSAKQLQEVLQRQNDQLADQKFQQKIQQRTSEMLSGANQSLQNWKNVPTQTYVMGTADDNKAGGLGASVGPANNNAQAANPNDNALNQPQQNAIVKTGDVLFAVIDTSVNSDEPGPILATIVTGRLKGAKLIGSFNLPSNASKMIISFNTLSVPGASRTVSISAFAIDANTARTALSSNTNHHYLLRYGSLFASSFIEGFGNAFQSANTTITIGGSGSGNNTTTIQGGGAGQSALENAVIGLATVGKAWGQAAQQTFNTPTTVEVYSGTAIGVLFTQDLSSI